MAEESLTTGIHNHLVSLRNGLLMRQRDQASAQVNDWTAPSAGGALTSPWLAASTFQMRPRHRSTRPPGHVSVPTVA